MSTSVDQRVVEMRFDNSQFESNVNTTIASVDKLSQKLNMEGASKGLEGVSAAAKGIDLAPLANAATNVGVKFSMLQMTMQHQLNNIVDAAVNAGKRIISALTIDPVKTGLVEYETKMNAIQVIQANTRGKNSMGDITSALDELNEYADNTIYNFAQMTSNIGKFTAQGYEVGEAANAVKGLANLAAASGASASDMARATYQMSQALGGTIRLIDWNSLRNANMATVDLKNTLIDIAKVNNIKVDEMIKKHGSFEQTLSEGWLSGKMFTEAMNIYSGVYSEAELKAKGFNDEQVANFLDLAETAKSAATEVKTITQLWEVLKETAQSGWTQTWELLIGPFDEAKKTLTEFQTFFSEIIGRFADVRNNFIGEAMNSNWDRLVEKVGEAGISVEQFEESLKGTLTEHGYEVDKVIKKHGSLANAFREGKITSYMLEHAIEDLSKSAGKANVDLSKITVGMKLGDESEGVKELQKVLNDLGYQVGEIDGKFGKSTYEALMAFEKASGLSIKGYVDDATLAALTEAAGTIKTIGDNTELATDEAIDLAKNITKASGRDLLFDSLKNVFSGLLVVLESVRNAFWDIFGIDPSQIYTALEGLKEFTSSLILSDDKAEQLRATFRGLFAAIDIVATIIGKVLKGAFNIVKAVLGQFNLDILGTTSSIGDAIVGFRDWIDSVVDIESVTAPVVSIIQKLGDGIRNFISSIAGSEAFAKFKGFLTDAKNSVVEWFSTLKSSGKIQGIFTKLMSTIQGWFQNIDFSNVSTILDGVWKVLTDIGSSLIDAAKSIGSGLAEAFTGDNLDNGASLLNASMLAGILAGVKGFIKSLEDLVTNGGGFMGGLYQIKEALIYTFGALQTQLKAGTLLKIAAAIAILAVSLLLLALINPDRLNQALVAITGLFADLVGSMKLFTMIGPLDGTGKVVGMMLGLAAAVLILAIAMKSIASLSIDEMAVALYGITALMGTMIGAMMLLSMNDKEAAEGAGQMILMAVALKILASVCKDLGELSWEQLAKGIVGVAAFLGLFVGMQALLKLIKPENMISSAFSLILIGAAMEIFADVCGRFGNVDWESIGKAGAAMAGVMLLTAGFAYLSKFGSNLMSSAAALVIIGIAMEIFADVCNKFGGIDWESLGKAGAGLAAVGLISSSLLAGSIALVIIGVAMEIFADVCSKFGGIDWSALAKAGVAMAGILLLAVGFGVLAGFAPAMIVASAALLVMAVALRIFAPVLMMLGSLSWEQVAIGLVAIAGAFAILGVAGLLLGPLAPAILALSAALLIFGVACLTIGGGVFLLVSGLMMLGAAGTAGAFAIVLALTMIVGAIASLIPIICEKLGEGVVAFAGAIAAGSIAIAEAVVQIITAILTTVNENIGPIMEAAMQIILSFVQGISDNMQQITDAAGELIANFLLGLADCLPDIIAAAAEVISSLIQGLVDAVDILLPDLLAAGEKILNTVFEGIETAVGIVAEAVGGIIGEFVGGILKGMAESVADVDVSNITDKAKEFFDSAKSLVDNVVSGLKSGVTDVDQAAASLAAAGIQGLESKVDDATTIGNNFVTFFVNAIKSKEDNVKSTGSSLGGRANSGVRSTYSSLYQSGQYIAQGLINGMEVKKNAVYFKGYELGKKAADGVKEAIKEGSPSKITYQSGLWFGEGFVNGMDEMGKKVHYSGVSMGEKAVRGVSDAISRVSNLVNSDIDTQPTIRPVMDLSDVSSGVKAIGAMFNGRQSLSASANLRAIGPMMNGRQNRGNEDVVSAIRELRNEISKGGNTYQINGITYDDGSNVSEAVKAIVRAARVERRV